MRRVALLLGLALAAGCGLDSTAATSLAAPAATATGCARLAPPPAPAGAPPTAVVRDIAGGVREFYAGSPGGRLDRLTEATGSSPPRLAAALLFYSTGQDPAAQEIRAAGATGCSTRVAQGTMGEVEPAARALVVTDASHSRIVSTNGTPVADIAGPNGTWTGDGHLAVATASTTLKVYDLAGTERDLALPPGATPLGPLGASLEMLATPAGFMTIDVRDGRVQSLAVPASTQRVLAGSRDGAYVAMVDSGGAPQLASLRDGHVQPLPNPGPSLGVLFDAASQWVAVESLYGGALLRISDGKVVDLGPLEVVSW